ncbi:uncharacterized protein LOC143876770 [Tasmannia lanceolata]|uniref:uncharacterized protein LOC143876770 n=1 Tax=Tasmannia lanceolata TaxID=3420 RepID=UPI0040640948
MGRKLDILLGRNFKLSKLKSLLGLALSRLTVLKNQRQVRCTQDRNDAAQLIKLGQQDRALLRVEHVIKAQNMLDVFVLIEGYCHLLTERLVLVQNQKDCPHELKEAISSLIFAASRLGEFPELQEIRWIFTSRYGKEFAASAVDLRNSCGVNPQMIEKMSTKQPSLESRMNVMNQIASENGITMELEKFSPAVVESNLSESSNQPKPVRTNPEEDSHHLRARLDREEQFSGSMEARKKYTDVASAAQAAFESAAYAAEAARAAVKLSRSESLGRGSDDQSSPRPRMRNISDRTSHDGSLRSRSGLRETGNGIPPNVEVESFTGGLGFEKIHPTQNYSSESENEVRVMQGFKNKSKTQLDRSTSSSSVESIGDTLEKTVALSNKRGWTKTSEKAALFDESDEDTDKEMDKQTGYTLPKSRGRTGYGLQKPRQFNEGSDEEILDKNDGIGFHFPYQKRSPKRHEADSEKQSVQRLNIEKRPISVRTRRGS